MIIRYQNLNGFIFAQCFGKRSVQKKILSLPKHFFFVIFRQFLTEGFFDVIFRYLYPFLPYPFRR